MRDPSAVQWFWRTAGRGTASCGYSRDMGGRERRARHAGSAGVHGICPTGGAPRRYVELQPSTDHAVGACPVSPWTSSCRTGLPGCPDDVDDAGTRADLPGAACEVVGHEFRRLHRTAVRGHAARGGGLRAFAGAGDAPGLFRGLPHGREAPRSGRSRQREDHDDSPLEGIGVRLCAPAALRALGA